MVLASTATFAFKVLVALTLPATNDEPVALSKNNEEKNPVIELRILAKKLVEVAADPEAFANVSFAMVAEADVKSEIEVVLRLARDVVAARPFTADVNMPVVVEYTIPLVVDDTIEDKDACLISPLT